MENKFVPRISVHNKKTVTDHPNDITRKCHLCVEYISIEEHNHLMAEAEKRAQRLVEALEKVKGNIGAIRASQHVGLQKEFTDPMWASLDAATEALAKCRDYHPTLTPSQFISDRREEKRK